MSQTLVIGAGLSGLACAYELHQRKRDVILLEARSRPGGFVGSIEVDGFRFEMGPNTIATSARTFRELCVRLGIANLWVPSQGEASARFLWHECILEPVPMGPMDLVRTPLLSGSAKRRLLSEPLRRFAHHPDDRTEPTLAAFLAERLGEEPMRRFAAPLVRGIYAGHIEKLGARSAFPRLWQMVNEHGGLARGAIFGRKKSKPPAGPEIPRGRLISFRRGLSTLIEALASSLGPALRTDAPVRALHRRGGFGEGWKLELEDGSFIEGDELVLATPAPEARTLLATLPADSGLDTSRVVANFDAIHCSSITLVHLGIDESELPGRPRGFGYLVPPDTGPEAPRSMGTVFGSDLFPTRAPEGFLAATAFYRPTTFQTGSDEEAGRIACEDLARAFHLSKTPEPRVVKVVRWTDAIPQYGVGHAERMREIEADLARSLGDIHLAGNFIAGVSVDDVLSRGMAIAERTASGHTHEVLV